MIREVTAISRYFNMWFMLGLYDIRHRYRRSLIGPLWITISTGLMVGSIGLIFSKIFNSPIEEFLPYFAAGQIVWVFISMQLTDACSAFILYQSIIKQISIPLSVHILRKLWYNVILFFHNFLIILVVLFISGRGISWEILYVLPAFILIATLLFMISVILGIVCSRFRDITQVVGVLLQLIYFFTPIIWMKNTLPAQYSWISDMNPFFHMIELIRLPLRGFAPDVNLWLYMFIYIGVSSVAAYFFMWRFRHRVAYWL